MYRKIALFAVLILCLIFLGSCVQKTDKYSKKEAELDANPVTLEALGDSLIALHQKVQETVAHAKQVSDKCNSLITDNRALQEENQKFKAQLAQAREVIISMREQYETLFATQKNALEQKDKELRVQKNETWNLKHMNDALSGDREALQTELEQLKPWAKKWQLDSRRSVIEKIFGSGKAPVPDVIMPQLE